MAPLVDCRAHPANDRAATACATALLIVYDKLDRLDEGIALSAELVRRFPQSKRAFLGQVSLLTRAHRSEEVRRLLEARVARDPSDHQIESALANQLLEMGDFARGEKALDDLAKAGALPRWSTTCGPGCASCAGNWTTRRWPPRSGPSSRTSVTTPPFCTPSASAEAELGRPEEAYHTLLEEMDRRGDEGNISGAEWFVIGRIAECYGALDAAREAYAKVDRPKVHSPLDTWNLADRRLQRARRRAGALRWSALNLDQQHPGVENAGAEREQGARGDQ